MCRLVACAGPSFPVGEALFHGSHSLFRQSWAPRELLTGSVAADGYGVAWWPEGARDPLRVARAEPVWYDPDLRPLLAAQRGRVVQATLRNATPGLPVDRTGLMPFVAEGWAFSLNGYVPGFRERHMRALRSDLSPTRYGRLLGVSDAETLFLRALDALDAGLAPADALRRVAGDVEARLGPGEVAPLTMILSSADAAWAYHATVGGGPCNSLYLARSPTWLPGGHVLASEPLDAGSEWTPVAPGTVLRLRTDGSLDRGPA